MAHVEAGGGGTGEEVGEYGEAAAAAAADGGEAAAAAAAADGGGDNEPYVAVKTEVDKEREPGSVPVHTRTAEGGKTITMISHLETPLPDSTLGRQLKAYKDFWGKGGENFDQRRQEILSISIQTHTARNVPIFIIQCHGSFEDTLSVRGGEGADTPYEVSWARGRDVGAVKMTGARQWIIQNSPLGWLGVPSKREDNFAQYIGKNLSTARGKIFSSNPTSLFRDISESGKPVEGLPMFVPPHSLYADKTHTPWDDDREWTFSMVVLPIFQPTDVEQLQANFDKTSKYPWKFYYPDSVDFANDKWKYKNYEPGNTMDDPAEYRRTHGAPKAWRGPGVSEMEVEEHPYEKAAAKQGKLGGPKQTKTGAQHTPDGFRNTLTANKMARLVNRFILENDAYWKPGPDNKYWPIDPATGRKKDCAVSMPEGHRARVGELKEKYKLFVESWEALIPAEGDTTF